MTTAIITPQQAADQVIVTLAEQKKRLEALLPSFLTWDRATALVRTAILSNPGLCTCSKLSVVQGAEWSWRMGLELNGPMGHAWLLPFDTRDGRIALPITGYKGWMHMLERQNIVADVQASCVYSHEVEKGLFKIKQYPKELVHEIDPLDSTELKDENIVGAYARVVLKDGRVGQVWLPRGELNKLERSSRGGWKSSDRFPRRYPGMARKSAILQIFHRAELSPSSLGLSEAIAAENEVQEEIRTADYVETEEQPAAAIPAPEIVGPEPYVYQEREDKARAERKQKAAVNPDTGSVEPAKAQQGDDGQGNLWEDFSEGESIF